MVVTQREESHAYIRLSSWFVGFELDACLEPPSFVLMPAHWGRGAVLLTPACRMYQVAESVSAPETLDSRAARSVLGTCGVCAAEARTGLGACGRLWKPN